MMNIALNIQPYTAAMAILEISYLASALLFVVGLRMLSKPESARAGNIWAGVGMLLAIVATIFLHTNENGDGMKNQALILGSILIGSLIGYFMAKRVKMTAMPQFVSFFNATGGLSAALISIREYPGILEGNSGMMLVSLLGVSVGTISFSGSMVAYGKLDGKVGDIRKSFMTYVNLAFLAVVSILTAYLIFNAETPAQEIFWVYGLLLISLVYGISFVMPIGGADMPVVISLLNSLTGISAALGGLLYDNSSMIVGGILVGSSGIILTILMCKAMNRPLINVLIGAFGGGGAAGEGASGSMKEISASDAAVLLMYSQNVVIVPGYGLAVAQAQHACNELDKMLENNGVRVRYAIHPVAGRMPGHMNVLLAEADVPYSKLVEMDNINPDMENTDVVVVIGANDVVNPAAMTNSGSPIYGMPIIEAFKAKNILVMKRGQGKGYAGIENDLFVHDKTRMLYGNAKDTLQKLIEEVKML